MESELDKLLEDADRAWAKEEMAAETGYTPGSGGFNNSLGKLRTLGLMIREGGALKLNPDLIVL